MALPTPRSLNEILKSILQRYTYITGVSDLNKGSVNRSMLEAAAMSDFRIQGDIISALSAVDIDRATGADLEKIGLGKGVVKTSAKESNGVITIYQKSFTKIATKVYQGTAAPPAGSLIVNIADATGFPNSGKIYIGRGTNNLEGPLSYNSVVPMGSYYQVNLSQPTGKNHNVGEGVVLAQSGNRVIPAGSLAQTQSTLTSQAVTFRTLTSVTLLDGEDSLSNVPVICTQIGTTGNVSANSIVEFASAPFPNAATTNPLAFTTGRDVMSDIDYREFIKKTEQSRVKGTDLAIKQAAIGTASKDDNKTVTSAEIRKPASRQEPSILFIDDGTGYQPIFNGQGFEQILDSANGGEKYLQLQHEDVVKATVISNLTAPFSIAGGMTLSIKVGGILSEHLFLSTDFATDGSADTFELVNSINNNPNLLFSAKAFNNNTQMAIFANSVNNEDIEVVSPLTGVNANNYLGLSVDTTYSLRLYKNDKILNKDGAQAILYSKPQTAWQASITSGATLKLKVDSTGFQSISVVDADFVAYGYSTVSMSNSLESWASVLNTKVAGVTFSVESNQIKVVSNKGSTSAARLQISSDVSSNTLANADSMWDPSTSIGIDSDFVLNRATGQFQLTNPLISGDKITAGSQYTRGFVDSSSFSSGTATLSGSLSNIPKMYLIADATVARRAASFSNIITFAVSNPSSNVWRYTFSAAGLFPSVTVNDIVIITNNNASLNAANVGDWRIAAVDPSGYWFEVRRSSGSAQTAMIMTGADDIIFVNSPDGVVKSIELPFGLQTLTTLANTIQSLSGIATDVIGGKKIRIFTQSYSSTGSVSVVGFNAGAMILGYTLGLVGQSSISHTAHNSSTSDITFTEMFHDSIATGDSSAPYTDVVTTTDMSGLGFNPDRFMLDLNPYAKISSNKGLQSPLSSVINTNVTIKEDVAQHEIVAGDRYALGVPFDFDAQDNVVAVIDGDSVTKSFNINLGRKGTIYASPNASTFNAHDTDFSPTANYVSGFGDNFDFSNFKIHLKSKAVLDPAGSNNSMLVKAAYFGPSGDRIKVGITYPQNESASMSSSILNGKDTVVSIALASGALRTGGGWDATTSFDVTNTSGNIWRYTYNGTGTAANFLSAGILVGDLVSVNVGSTFSAANCGTFKVTNITNMYFEVRNCGSAVAETGKLLASAASLKFFPLDSANNTANLMQTFVTADSQLPSFIALSQIENGTGTISTSTFDDTAGASSTVSLMDGENWISSSSIGTTLVPTNLFVLKQALNIFGSNMLNEEFYIIPLYSEQLNRILNLFAITGLTSFGNISLADASRSVQIYSSLFGSSGSVYITGGSGNSTSAAVTESASVVDDSYIKFAIAKAASVGFHRNQWVKITNTSTIAKDTNLSATSQITWSSATPVPGTSRIAITNSNAGNIYQTGYFWTSRYHNAVSGSQFKIEKQGPLVAISWTGTGTAPQFTRQFNITNISRTSYISTITLSSAHGVTVGSSIQLNIASLTNSSMNGLFRCVASSSTELQFRQDGLVDIASVADIGTATRMVRKTDRINLSGPFSAGNLGEFSVVGTYGSSTIYIKNSSAVEEEVSLMTATNIKIFDYDSVRPGDTLSVGSTILDSTSPYESHVGELIVSDIGSETQLFVTSATAQSSVATLGSSYTSVRVIEQDVFSMYGKIYNISPSAFNASNSDVVISGIELPSKITPSFGSSIIAVSKLGFSTDVKVGEDSYKYYGGLISAVGQKIRGKSSDPVSYPGYSATGSFIEIDSALPKRIQLSIVIRNRTGTPFSVIKSRVQSAVAAYINSLGVGQSVVFAEIISAVQALDGIQASAISSPTYNATNDQIISQPNQKPLVLKLDSDIVVSQAV